MHCKIALKQFGIRFCCEKILCESLGKNWSMMSLRLGFRDFWRFLVSGILFVNQALNFSFSGTEIIYAAYDNIFQNSTKQFLEVHDTYSPQQL